jgi:aconitase A
MHSKNEKSDALEKQEKRELRRKLRIYQGSLRHTLATTRFNNYTWEENCKMRRTNPTAKCIYATPIQITSRIVLDSNVFVLEMNNEKDQIMGIGLIKNHAVAGKYAVHSVQNYNRFVYIGKWRIDREEMTDNEMEMLLLLEAVCFRGINHSKRGQGITALPLKLQYKSHLLGLDLLDFVCNMFKSRMDT